MYNDEIIVKGLEIYRKNKLKYQVFDYLKSQGLSEEETQEKLSQVINAYQKDRKNYLKKRNLILFLSIILLFFIVAYIFYFILPKTSMRESPFITSVLGAGLLMLILYHIIAFYGTWSDQYLDTLLKDNSDIQINYSFLFVMLLPAIIPYFILDSKYKDEIETQILLNGVEVEGEILNGWSEQIRGRRRGSIEDFYVEVEFKDATGKKNIVKKQVDRSLFNKFYKGQKVIIVYDRNSPQNIEILNDTKSIRKFTDLEERDVSGKDLFNLLEINDPHSILEMLNSISLGWSKRNDQFINERRFEMVEMSDGIIVYSIKKMFFDTVIKQFENKDFKLTEEKRSKFRGALSKTNVYENENYIVEVEQKPITDQKNHETYVFTVIVIMKKE